MWDFIKSFPSIFDLVSVSRAQHVQIAVQFIAAIDLFMVAVVMYVMGIGLFELFVSKQNFVIYPRWLKMRDLNDFKSILISAVVVVLAITFLKHLVTWKNALDTLYFGASIAIFIIAIAVFSRWLVHKENREENAHNHKSKEVEMCDRPSSHRLRLHGSKIQEFSGHL